MFLVPPAQQLLAAQQEPQEPQVVREQEHSGEVPQRGLLREGPGQLEGQGRARLREALGVQAVLEVGPRSYYLLLVDSLPVGWLHES